jgi:hypothetical protein
MKQHLTKTLQRKITDTYVHGRDKHIALSTDMLIGKITHTVPLFAYE